MINRLHQVQAAVFLLGMAALAWMILFFQTRGMAPQLSFPGFIAVWVIMMAAMMLPSFAPIASRYIKMMERRKWSGTVGVVAGYMGIWSLVGFAAYFLGQRIDALIMARPDAAIPLAVAIFAIGGVYQFTPLKDRCLTHCRTPFAQLLQYASWQGKARHLRVGLHQGAYCAGCCWSLMLLLFAFGMMNMAMMVVIAGVVAGEKLWARGKWFSYLVGGICLISAVAVIWFPQLAPGLALPAGSMMMP